MNRQPCFFKNLFFCFSFLIFISALSGAPARADSHRIKGPAKAIDGQTLMIGLEKIRLFGISVPELDQQCKWPHKVIPCGQVSRTALLDLIAASTVQCQILNNRATPPVATCRVGGFDVGRNMVHTGWAIAAKGDPAGYGQTENRARGAKRGLWRGTFAVP